MTPDFFAGLGWGIVLTLVSLLSILSWKTRGSRILLGALRFLDAKDSVASVASESELKRQNEQLQAMLKKAEMAGYDPGAER